MSSTMQHQTRRFPVGYPYDVNQDGNVDEYDAGEVYAQLSSNDLCEPAVICIWDVGKPGTVSPFEDHGVHGVPVA
jgi:hypothetical protein